MQKTKRILSIVLSFMMLISMLTVGVVSTNAATTDTQETGEKITFTGTERIYVSGGTTSYWYNDSAKLWAYLFDGDAETWVQVQSLSRDGSNTADGSSSEIYYMDMPAGTWGQIIFVRKSDTSTTSGWSSVWNQTGDIVLSSSLNSTTNHVTGFSVGGTSLSYSDYAVAPTAVTATVEGTTGTGTQEDPYIVSADQAFTITANATFDDSNMTASYSVNGGTYAVGSQIAMEAMVAGDAVAYTVEAKGTFDSATSSTSEQTTIYIKAETTGYVMDAVATPAEAGATATVNGQDGPITVDIGAGVQYAVTDTNKFYAFEGWFVDNGDVPLSTDLEFLYTPTQSETLEARFRKKEIAYDFSGLTVTMPTNNLTQEKIFFEVTGAVYGGYYAFPQGSNAEITPITVDGVTYSLDGGEYQSLEEYQLYLFGYNEENGSLVDLTGDNTIIIPAGVPTDWGTDENPWQGAINILNEEFAGGQPMDLLLVAYPVGFDWIGYGNYPSIDLQIVENLEYQFNAPTIDTDSNITINNDRTLDDQADVFVYDNATDIVLGNILTTASNKMIARVDGLFETETDAEAHDVVIGATYTTTSQTTPQTIEGATFENGTLTIPANTFANVLAGEVITISVTAQTVYKDIETQLVTNYAVENSAITTASQTFKIVNGYEERLTAPTNLTYSSAIDVYRGRFEINGGVYAIELRENTTVTINNVSASGSKLQGFVGDIAVGEPKEYIEQKYDYSVYWKDNDIQLNSGSLIKTVTDVVGETSIELTVEELNNSGIISGNSVTLYIVANPTTGTETKSSEDVSTVKIMTGLYYGYSNPTQIDITDNYSATNNRYWANQDITLNVLASGSTVTPYVDVDGTPVAQKVGEEVSSDYYSYRVYDGEILLTTVSGGDEGVREITIPAGSYNTVADGTVKELTVKAFYYMPDKLGDLQEYSYTVTKEITLESPFKLTDNGTTLGLQEGTEVVENENTVNPEEKYVANVYANAGTYWISLSGQIATTYNGNDYTAYSAILAKSADGQDVATITNQNGIYDIKLDKLQDGLNTVTIYAVALVGKDRYEIPIYVFELTKYANALQDDVTISAQYDGQDKATDSQVELSMFPDGQFIFNVSGGTVVGQREGSADPTFTYTVATATGDELYTKDISDLRFKLNINKDYDALSTQAFPVGNYIVTVKATYGEQVQTQTYAFEVLANPNPPVEPTETTVPEYDPSGETSIAPETTLKNGDWITIFVASDDSWNSQVDRVRVSGINSEIDGVYISEGSIIGNYGSHWLQNAQGVNWTQHKYEVYKVSIKYHEDLKVSNIEIGNSEEYYIGELPDGTSKVTDGSYFFAYNKGYNNTATHQGNGVGSVLAPSVESFTTNDLSIVDLQLSDFGVATLPLSTVLSYSTSSYSSATEKLDVTYYVNGVQVAKDLDVSSTTVTKDLLVSAENGFVYGANYVTITIGDDEYETTAYQGLITVNTPMPTPKITSVADEQINANPTDTGFTLNSYEETKIITVVGEYLEYAYYTFNGREIALVTDGSKNVTSASFTMPAPQAGLYADYTIYSFKPITQESGTPQVINLSVGKEYAPGIDFSQEVTPEGNSMISDIIGNLTYTIVGKDGLLFAGTNGIINATQEHIEGTPNTYKYIFTTTSTDMVMMFDGMQQYMLEKPIWNTSYFMITDEMAKAGFNTWEDFEKYLTVQVKDAFGNVETGVIGTNIVIEEIAQDDTQAFGTSYELNGTLLKVSYTDKVVEMKFFMDGAENDDKLSTPFYAVENEKVFYIEDFASYDSSAVVTSNMLFDKEYSVSIDYPNLDGSQGTNIVTQKVLLSTDVRKFAVSENRYYTYEFSTLDGNMDHITGDILITAAATEKTYALNIPVETLLDGNLYSQGLEEAKAEVKVYAISVEPNSTSYNVYNDTYESFTGQYSADLTYGYTAWISAPIQTASGHTFVGWYDEDRDIFVSYESEYKFIMTQGINLVPIYSDNTAVTVSTTPYTLAENALYEVYSNAQGTTKIRYSFPLTYFTPDGVTVDAYKVRYQVATEGAEVDMDGAWVERDLTGNLNSQGRVNYILSTDYYNADGNYNKLTLYIQPFIEYNGMDTKDSSPIVGATYAYPTY